MIRYLPFDDGPHKMAMGLKPLEIADWIEIDDELASDLALKNELLAQRHVDVFAETEGSRAAQREVLQTLVDHLVRHHAGHYERDGDVLRLAHSDHCWNVAAQDQAPLEIAGRLVQEDFCLMEDDGSGIYHLTAASLCFPTRWLLADKIARPLQQIHGPVPGYDENLAPTMDRFFMAMPADKPVWRLNWSLVDRPDLHLAVRDEKTALNPDISARNAGAKVWLRVERQTLRRLPESGAILFTIRIYRTAISDVVAVPGAAAKLLTAISNLPDATRHYKSILPYEDALCRYLQGRAKN